jgi:hypothetical protein
MAHDFLNVIGEEDFTGLGIRTVRGFLYKNYIMMFIGFIWHGIWCR